MIIYEVTLLIDRSISTSYRTWLKEHVMEMLTFDGFIEARIYSEENSLNRPIPAMQEQLIVQYHIDSEEHLHHYFKNHADHMRKKALDQFGGLFKAERRVLNIEHIITRTTNGTH